MAARQPKFWAWGYEDELLSAEEKQRLGAFYAEQFGVDGFDETPVPRTEEFDLPAPRLTPPATLAPICTSAPHQRLIHAYGKSYPDAERFRCY